MGLCSGLVTLLVSMVSYLNTIDIKMSNTPFHQYGPHCYVLLLYWSIFSSHQSKVYCFTSLCIPIYFNSNCTLLLFQIHFILHCLFASYTLYTFLFNSIPCNLCCQQYWCLGFFQYPLLSCCIPLNICCTSTDLGSPGFSGMVLSRSTRWTPTGTGKVQY